MPRENRVEKSRVHCSCQAQNFVQFWEIAGAQNVAFFHTKGVSKMGRVRSAKRGVQCKMTISWSDHGRIMLGSCSERPRIVFLLSEAIRGFLAEILNSEFRGKRSTW